MNDQPTTAAGQDVLGWLDATIAKVQQEAEPRVGLGTCPSWGHCEPDCFHPDGIGVNNSADIVRRCIADRKILELHAVDGTSSSGCPWCRTCSEQAPEDGYHYLVPSPCPTILALAEGYGWTGTVPV
jgi:hypothetical protein